MKNNSTKPAQSTMTESTFPEAYRDTLLDLDGFYAVLDSKPGQPKPESVRGTDGAFGLLRTLEKARSKWASQRSA